MLPKAFAGKVLENLNRQVSLTQREEARIKRLTQLAYEKDYIDEPEDLVKHVQKYGEDVLSPEEWQNYENAVRECW